MVLRRPIGMVAAFSPWNFPMSSPARAFHGAGLPPGVLNFVFGVPSEISEYLIPQDAVRLITFTGSISVGERLAEMAGRHMKPSIMELGEHAPVIVCDDVKSR
jgi:succinate-semialdehyde dehydrogenase/glutarate-semialdehyde dehydrogenase